VIAFRFARCNELLERCFSLIELPFRLCHSGLCLKHLLIEIGRFDIGQLLAGCARDLQYRRIALSKNRWLGRKIYASVIGVMFPGKDNCVLGAARLTTVALTSAGVTLYFAASAPSCFVVLLAGEDSRGNKPPPPRPGFAAQRDQFGPEPAMFLNYFLVRFMVSFMSGVSRRLLPRSADPYQPASSCGADCR